MSPCDDEQLPTFLSPEHAVFKGWLDKIVMDVYTYA